jgi:REP element-mobilizing transposase RayT
MTAIQQASRPRHFCRRRQKFLKLDILSPNLARMPPGEPPNRKKFERLSWLARSKPAKPAQGGRPGDLVEGWHSRGYLPHLKAANASYFVTVRLADSLPREVVLKLGTQAERKLELAAKSHNAKERLKVERKAQREHFRSFEQWLDAGHGSCWLRRSEIAQLVADAFLHFRDTRYVLHGWVLMPNHAHVVVQPLPGHTLSSVLHSWKSYTSKEAQKLIQSGPSATFWQRESYNHWCRDDAERARCIAYVENNPVKARFCHKPEDWPWSSASERAK